MSWMVALEDEMASDIAVVKAARVSTGKGSLEMGEAEEGLINFLMRERHGTPFEHAVFRFKIACPLFVAREWFRHRIGSFNELSGRYSVIPDEFFVPDVIRKQVGKPGAYKFEEMDEDASEIVKSAIRESSAQAFETYNNLLAAGVAKEVARMVLPVNMMTEFYWTVNSRSLMNFLSLRTAPQAQLEIRVMAESVERAFKYQMPVTHAAWVANGKVAP